MDFAAQCRLSPVQSGEVIDRVVAAVGQWRTTASRNGLPPKELAVFGDAIDTQLAALTAHGAG